MGHAGERRERCVQGRGVGAKATRPGPGMSSILGEGKRLAFDIVMALFFFSTAVKLGVYLSGPGAESLVRSAFVGVPVLLLEDLLLIA